MFVLSQLFRSLAVLFDMIFGILYFLLVIRIILSWFAVNPYSELYQILFRITEPILAPFRRLPLQIGMIDFTPILAFIILRFLHVFVVGTLNSMALRFG